MPLTCNIDARGKLARLVYGLVLVVIAVVLATFWAWNAGSVARWIIVVSCFVAGAFGIFEGWAGWCVMRAIGFKTPL